MENDNVFEPAGTLELRPIGWHLARPEIIKISGSGFIGFTNEVRYDLPTEFFNHQLSEVDAADEDSLLAFVAEYGVPVHPLRWARSFYDLSFDEEKAAFRAALDGEPLSDDFRMLESFSSVAPDDIDRALWLTDSQLFHGFDEQHNPEEPLDGLVSLKEIRITILDLQKEIQGMFEYMRGAAAGWDARWINDGLRMRPRGIIVTDGHPVSRDAMTAAICEQVADFVALDRPFWECPCGRIFKRFQPRSGYASPKAPPRSRFCCERCRDKYTKAEYRKNKKKATSKAD